ncbi:MAG: TetR family transcriptional regulator [Actinomycetales bacterium]|nr:TetR family transcriptional regulator [Actinomycetales bacterium]
MTIALSEQERRASAAYIAKHGRRRPAHAIRNDARIDSAIIAVIAESGWDDCSINRVAKHAGMSGRSLHARHPDLTAMGIHAWDTMLHDPLTDALDAAITAGLAADTTSTQARAATLAAFAAAMEPLLHPSTEIRAGLELLLGSQFDPAQRAAILEPTTAWLRDRTQPPDVPPDPVRAAQATAIAIWALGLVIFANRPWVATMDPAPALARIHDALASPAAPAPMPGISTHHFQATPFHTGDPRVDTILTTASQSIGQVGYHRTHVRIATDAAGVSESFAFIRFPSKTDLLLAITDTAYRQGYEDFRAFTQGVAATHGPGIAEAVTWQAYLHPDTRPQRTTGIELNRLVNHNPRIRQHAHDTEAEILTSLLASAPQADLPQLTGHVHLEFASGHGLPIIGNLLPDAWTLPFDAITTPHTAASPLPG